jgi:hypothetical protein
MMQAYLSSVETVWQVRTMMTIVIDVVDVVIITQILVDVLIRMLIKYIQSL